MFKKIKNENKLLLLFFFFFFFSTQEGEFKYSDRDMYLKMLWDPSIATMVFTQLTPSYRGTHVKLLRDSTIAHGLYTTDTILQRYVC